MGSPPRGRGKGIFAILALSATGITPAWAGKRCLNDLVDVDWQDHPRVGGEKEWTVHYHRQTEGSPPRGRGKGIKRSSHAHQTGITPAWAGKRSWKHDHVRKHGDHPRVGGEKSFIYQFPFFRRGSPPRGRGKAACGALAGGVQRITPAWAGKSAVTDWTTTSRRDHPRVGGEKWSSASPMNRLKGSPPRGRGKVTRLYALADLEGITPAWAGKSGLVRSMFCASWDHPRVGGEKTKKIP